MRHACGCVLLVGARGTGGAAGEGSVKHNFRRPYRGRPQRGTSENQCRCAISHAKSNFGSLCEAIPQGKHCLDMDTSRQHRELENAMLRCRSLKRDGLRLLGERVKAGREPARERASYCWTPPPPRERCFEHTFRCRMLTALSLISAFSPLP